jgi:hypothetical protein
MLLLPPKKPVNISHVRGRGSTVVAWPKRPILFSFQERISVHVSLSSAIPDLNPPTGLRAVSLRMSLKHLPRKLLENPAPSGRAQPPALNWQRAFSSSMVTGVARLSVPYTNVRTNEQNRRHASGAANGQPDYALEA